MNNITAHEKITLLPGLKSLGVLLSAYFGFRLLFYTFPELKTLFFIYPAGGLVAFFTGMGFFDGSEWIYPAGGIKIRFGELCSGTTFFSLLSAYTLMKYTSGGLSAWWLAACYPLALLANAARVLCSIYVYAYTARQFPANVHEQIHLFVGVVVFVSTLIALTLFWERKALEDCFEHPAK